MMFRIRNSTEEDVPLILKFIKELAAYEKLEHEAVATEDILRQTLFGERPTAEVIIGEEGTNPVAFALFFYNFSTFLGRPGIYLEDLYVSPKVRGKGYGKKILAYLARLAKKRGCGRLEWWCLDWNKEAISFYLSLGAEAMSDWTVYRMAGKALDDLSSC